MSILQLIKNNYVEVTYGDFIRVSDEANPQITTEMPLNGDTRQYLTDVRAITPYCLKNGKTISSEEFARAFGARNSFNHRSVPDEQLVASLFHRTANQNRPNPRISYSVPRRTTSVQKYKFPLDQIPYRKVPAALLATAVAITACITLKVLRSYFP